MNYYEIMLEGTNSVRIKTTMSLMELIKKINISKIANYSEISPFIKVTLASDETGVINSTKVVGVFEIFTVHFKPSCNTNTKVYIHKKYFFKKC